MGVIDGEQYNDDFKSVAKNYLKGGFLFDVATSIPVAFVELYVVSSEACATAGADGSVSGGVDST